MLPAADFELAWPPELFTNEAQALLQLVGSFRGRWSDAVELLLEEAFTGTVPLQHFRALASSGDPWGQPADPLGDVPAETQETFLRRLASTSADLPRADQPRPYWSRRRQQPCPEPAPADESRLAEWFLLVVRDLIDRGYFDYTLPAGCEDAGDEDLVDPSLVLLERIGVPDLWPLAGSRQAWDPTTNRGTFYDLVEALHDVAARPRSRSFHSYWRHWHYADFSSPAGQGVYRWKVNRVLELTGTGLQLAGSGEDVGRLVNIAGDERDDLVQRVIAVETERGTRAHAVALFRGRDAGEPEKRSAIIALAGLLEQRRDLLRAELFSNDEGALFTIANQFNLRHRRADQRSDYAEAYLDWLFWWYLATVELTDRLLQRQADSH